ncbi:hypothetical protein KBA41_15280 [Candidatus Ozemobacteraceae bacterium]|nr:hypothetical protein [Candidatus Ozemobacteraceae bacterium]
MKQLHVDISLPEATYRALEAQATKEGRTTDDLVRNLVVSYIKVQAAKSGKTAGDIFHELALSYIKASSVTEQLHHGKR